MLDDPWNDDADDLPRAPAHRRRRDRAPSTPAATALKREPRRLAVLGLVGALLVLAGLSSGGVRPPRGTAAVVPAAASVGGMPVVIAAAASSSAWYCPGPLPVGPGGDAASIVLTGTSGASVRGRVTIVKSDGSISTVPVVVPAHGTMAVPVTGGVAGGKAGWAAASVELQGGGVAATQVVAAPNGPSGVPCEVTNSSSWYFPAGSTAPGADLQLSLYNPTAAPAIANLSFAASSQFTSTGAGSVGRSAVGGTPVTPAVQPPPFQGLTVPPGQLVVVDVGREVQLQPELAATVTTAAGRLVAGEWTSVILGGAHEGSLTQGVAQPEKTWWFPVSDASVPGADAIGLWIYNPSQTATSAEVLLPVTAAETSSISVIVPPTSLVVVSPPVAVTPSGHHHGKAAPPPATWAEVESAQAGVVVARAGLSEVSRARGARGHRVAPGFVGTGLPGAVVGAASPAGSWLLAGTGPAATGSDRALGGGSVAITVPAGQSAAVPVTIELVMSSGSSPTAAVVEMVRVAPGSVQVVGLPKSVSPSASLLLVAGGLIVAERDYTTGGSAGSLDSVGIPVA